MLSKEIRSTVEAKKSYSPLSSSIQVFRGSEHQYEVYTVHFRDFSHVPTSMLNIFVDISVSVGCCIVKENLSKLLGILH